MHDYVKNLAKVVRAAREEAHLSQAALAEQIGCDERTILNIENDRGNPKFIQGPEHTDGNLPPVCHQHLFKRGDFYFFVHTHSP